MRRSFLRGSLVAVVGLAALVLAPVQPASATHVQCSDEGPPPGTVVQQGTPTTTPPTHYQVTTTGIEATVGPIAGVGTIFIEVNAVEVAVVVRNPSGNVVFAGGVDPSPGTTTPTVQEWELAVCAVAPAAGRVVYVDVDDPDPARSGNTVRVFTCGYDHNPCRTLLGHTGTELSLNVILASCVWLNGFQQNTTVSCPATDPGTGPQL